MAQKKGTPQKKTKRPQSSAPRRGAPSQGNASRQPGRKAPRKQSANATLERRRREQARRLNEQRRIRRRKKKRALFSIILLLFVVGGGIFLTVRLFFNVETVTVTGNDRYETESILKTASIQQQQNLFEIPKEEIAGRLKDKYAYIKDVNIRFHLPTGVEIAITQETPVAAVRDDNGYTILSASGKVLETGIDSPDASIPKVLGVDVSGMQVLDKIPKYLEDKSVNPQYQRLVVLERLLECARSEGEITFTAVDLTDIYNVYAYYGDKLKVVFGSENEMEYKMKGFSKLLAGELENFSGTVDLTTPSNISTRPGHITLPESVTDEGEAAPSGDEETISSSSQGE